MRLRLPVTLAILLALTSAQLHADLATITVDIAKRTVAPNNPTVNIAANDAVILHIIANDKELDTGTRIETTIAGPRALSPYAGRTGFYTQYDYFLPAITGPAPLLIFRRCDRATAADYQVITYEDLPSGKKEQLNEPRCPFYTVDASNNAWTVVLDQGIILVRILAGNKKVEGPAAAEKPLPEFEHAFAIQVVNRKYALNWSAGFAFLGLRDYQYRTDPIPGNDNELKLSKNGLGEVPYQLSAFAHYARLFKRTQSFAFSFGLATKVPVNELTAMIGGTMSLRTLPLVNSGHLTVGLAYGPRKELISDYRGRSTVPVGTSPASLTATRYGFAPFLAITFSFFGGEEQFKGVYSGNSAPTESK